jgi:hypothetical protein
MTGWPQLSPEIRLFIFAHIKNNKDFVLRPRRRVNYSMVCKEWHHTFEPELFHSLILDQHRLEDFNQFVSQNESRRKFVKHLFLRVKLVEYDCSVCESQENDETREAYV